MSVTCYIVENTRCREYKMQRIQGAEPTRCREYKVQSLQGAENTRCREYKVQGIQGAEPTRCREYKVQRIQGAEPTRCENTRCREYKVQRKFAIWIIFLCSRDYKINHDGFSLHKYEVSICRLIRTPHKSVNAC